MLDQLEREHRESGSGDPTTEYVSSSRAALGAELQHAPGQHAAAMVAASECAVSFSDAGIQQVNHRTTQQCRDPTGHQLQFSLKTSTTSSVTVQGIH